MDGWKNRMNDGWTDRHVLWGSPPRSGSGPSVTTGHIVRQLTVTQKLPLEEVLGDHRGRHSPTLSCRLRPSSRRSVQGQLRECLLSHRPRPGVQKPAHLVSIQGVGRSLQSGHAAPPGAPVDPSSLGAEGILELDGH